MIIPKPQDALHKAWLYRLLMTIADDTWLMQVLRFKGGTCAAMLDRLDRFSIDLDFDLVSETQAYRTLVPEVCIHLEKCFKQCGVEIKQFSKRGVQYFLHYQAEARARSTIKVEASFPPPHSNMYEATYFSEIDRTISCHTIETMFANKLVAVLDRWETHRSLAGRDIYDIHHFFMQGYRYHPAIIRERRSSSERVFFKELIHFIQTHVTQTTLQQDLNSLLPTPVFQRLYKTLKTETVMLLQDELKRLSKKHE